MSIEPSDYTRQDVFDAELAHLYATRMYVGSVHDFLEVDAYLALSLGDTAFTLRRTTEGLRAFNNVCLHRCALIDPDGAGQRPFRCRYHAWAYASDGALRSAPLVDEAAIGRRQLEQYPVAVGGDHVFVGLSGAAPDIDKVPYALEQIGVPSENPLPFHRGELLQNCNWKLLVENNIESYHLSFVHPQSFIPAGFVSKSDYEWKQDTYTCWSSCVPTASTTKLPLLKRIARDATHDFRHVYIFPNLFLTTTNQMVGFRSYMIPLGPAHTLFKWELFELPTLLALAAPLREQIRAEAVRFTITSLQEDKPLVEACQRGLASRHAALQLQPLEARIRRFHDYYREQMDHAAR
jgi:phenylpropionate dioxygenase-like ring-hydroxylating dioxygenase large terminal subunit